MDERTAALVAANEALLSRVADLERSVAALRASDRGVLDGIPGMVCTMSTAGEIETVNRRILEFFGRPAEELQAWRASDSIHPDDLATVVGATQRAMTTGEPFRIENRCRRSDGVYRWFQAETIPVRDVAGRITRWCSLLTDIDDRKHAEDAIRASERNLAETIDAIPAMAWSANPDGTAEFFNGNYLDFVGMTTDAARGWGWTTAVHPDDLQGLAEAWQRIMASGQTGATEARLRRFDGEYRWFLFRANPLHGESGSIVRWYGTNTDIEDRRRAEEAVRASERDLGNLINTIPVLAWCNNPDGSNEFLNKPWHDYTGLSPQEAHGWGWQIAIHADDLPPLIEKWTELLASGESGEIEARLRRFDGAYRWFLFRVNPLRDEAGTIVKWYGTNTDIDGRKRAEAEWRRSQAFLEEGQRLSSTGSFSWWVDTGEMEFSTEMYRIFEFEVGSPITISQATSRTHPEDVAASAARLGEARRSGRDLDYSVRLKMPGGAVKYIRSLARASRGRDDRLEYVGVCQDVTHARMVEEALGKARSELAHVARASTLGALTASIAHEVNQPLSGIVTNAGACLRMLAANPPNVDAACETARRTIRDANRASDVIKRLRALFGKKAANREAVNLNAAAQEVIALMLDELRRSGVELHLDLADELPSVPGDRVQLQQVIMNLLLNAADAMSTVTDRPRRLQIRSGTEEGKRIIFQVEDSGVGIEPQQAVRLFEAFYTTKPNGMGVGLSISRSIIESHHGRIWARPNRGPGATVGFSIPYGTKGVDGECVDGPPGDSALH